MNPVSLQPEPIKAPFPGLRPFQSHEAEIFCGRAEHVADMLTVLENQRFLAVVGPSGGGKSSLVFAGLIPALRQGELLTAESDDWRIVSLRPGESPYASLAAAAHAGLPDPAAPVAFHAGDQKLTEIVLRSSPLGLVEVIRDARVPASANILVLVDQFEELFRFQAPESASPAEAAQRRDDAACFVQLLLATARTTARTIHVMLTMRTDFLGDCDMFDGLPQAINRGQFLTPRLNLSQMEEIITRPLQLPQFQGTVDPDLVRRILNDVGTGRDELPLVQHALFRTWQRSRRNQPVRLTLEDYTAVGGLKNALSDHADEARAEFVSRGQERLVDRVFRGLSTRSAGGQQVRRPATVQQLADESGFTPAEVISVVEAFRLEDRCFLMPPKGKELKAGTMIDISHESLLRQWKTLRNLAEIEEKSAASFTRLRDTARGWPEEEPLLRETRLNNALKWRQEQAPTPAWAARYGGGLEQALNYLQASEDQRASEEAERVRAARAQEEKRVRRQRRFRIAALFAALLPIAGLSWFGYTTHQEKLAEAARAAEFQAKVKQEEDNEKARAAVSRASGTFSADKRSVSFPAGIAPLPVETLVSLKELSPACDTLVLKGTQVTREHLPVIGQLQTLRALDLSLTRIDNDALKDIGRMTHLTSLDLSFTLITDKGLPALENLKGLKQLKLAPNRLTQEGVDVLRKKLPGCEIEYPPGHPGRLIFALLDPNTRWEGAIPPLDNIEMQQERLKLWGTGANQPRLWFLATSSPPAYSVLDLQNSLELTNQSLQFFIHRKGLEKVYVSTCVGVTDRGFEALSRYPDLNHLEIKGSLMTAQDFEVLAGAPKLTHLVLEKVTILAPELPALDSTRESALKHLEMNECDLNTHLLELIGRKRRLEKLSLHDISKLEVPAGSQYTTNAGDQAAPSSPAATAAPAASPWQPLGNLAGLRDLELRRIPILKHSDLEFLSQLRQLEKLDLEGCSGLTAADIAQLRMRHPTVAITGPGP